MNYVWKRISKADVDRLAEKYNLEPFERRIIELRREGKSLVTVALKIGYSVSSVKRHSNKILKKIAEDL